jgi:hypothetical protein
MVVALLVLVPLAAAAFGVYPAGASGADIGYPQCGGAYPANATFGIVGVTHGRAFTYNTCLADEFAWAVRSPTPASLYMNINAAVGSTASNGNTGPLGACRPSDKACKNYNYGYNAAQDAYTYATQQGASASTWWLDIETANSWLTQTAINDEVIAGAARFFSERGLTVGVYSTNSQWSKIAGTYRPGLPVWYATAASADMAPSYCASAFDFAGGGVWLVQFPGGAYDADYACP